MANTFKYSKRRVKLGDLKHWVRLHNRDIVPPMFGSADISEDFNQKGEVYAAIKSVNGKTIFNGASGDVRVTHELAIRFDASVTTSTWVELKDKTLLDIIDYENVDEEDRFMRLVCVEQGSETLGANRV